MRRGDVMVADERTSAPEVSDKNARYTYIDTYDERVDVWAIGAIHYFLLTRSMMFKTFHESEKFQYSHKRQWHVKLNDPDGIGEASIETVNFLNTVMRYKPCDRPTTA